MTSATKISIIIPAYNEQGTITLCIENAKQACGTHAEIIVVDGHPDSSTIREIADSTILTIKSEAGRAVQMNTGAQAASGDILLFLHADTSLPPNAYDLICEALNAPASSAGAFKLSFDSNSTALNVIAFIADLRTRIERIPYGDQAVFIRKDIFFELGGFPDVPLMEDVMFFQNIKRMRREIVILKAAVKTSPRRYSKAPFRRAIYNTFLRVLHFCGIKPATLARMYN